MIGPTARSKSPLEKRIQRAARIALYGSLAVTLVLLAAGLGYLQSLRPATPEEDFAWQEVDWQGVQEVQLLRRYLQINTSQPNANELAGAQFLASVLAQNGIHSEIEVLGGHHANLWAVLPGADPRPLVLHSHIDTDPVTNPEEWHYPPWGGVIEGPYLYGRGAFDMKSIAIAQLMAFLDLAKSGKPLKRTVVFLATGAEEVGSDLGTKWLLAERPELLGQTWAFLTEGGVVETSSAHDVRYWGVEFAQRRLVDVTFCSPSQERLEALRQELETDLDEGNLEVRITPEVAAFMAAYGPTRQDPLLRRALTDLPGLQRNVALYARLPSYLKAFFRDEAHPFLPRQKADGTWTLLVKVHLLPGSSFEEAFARLLPDWRRAGLTWSVYDERGADHGAPLDHPAFEAMVDELRQAHPGAVVGPQFLPWSANDSRFLRAAGLPAYGFSPFLIPYSDTRRVGLPDERISLMGLRSGTEIYRRLVARLAY
ncbi:MAG TPA: M20/M25/M40 family metallo-hydrolase [Thermoanaerobaculia bacterium]|nr:M20/M25/M40 family metallo-hydrolase [Thermoanaerobaculia bacterium]